MVLNFLHEEKSIPIAVELIVHTLFLKKINGLFLVYDDTRRQQYEGTYQP